jgi:GT2 family glycosyltransferase
MGLSIVLVNYRTPQLQLDCFAEMFRDPVASTFEIIEVDNNSGDDSRERITRAFPMVKWIQLDTNMGFARANNVGIRHSTGDAILLLNTDTLPRGEVIQESYRRLMASDYVACGVQLLNADGSHQITGNYVMKGGLNYLLPLPYLGSLVKKMGDLFKVKKPHVPDKVGAIEVDWINGAYLMVKREAIDKEGLLDEDFFLYAEESEWCGRLRKAGKIVLYGDLEVIHLQGSTADLVFQSQGKGYGVSDAKGKQVMLSNFVRIRKQFGLGWFLFQLLFYIVDIPVFFFGVLFSGLSGKTRYNWKQFRQYCENVGVVISKSPKIIRNKPYFYKVI